MQSVVDHECTSWLVFHDLTGNNTNLLHKNRDAVTRPSRDVSVLISPAGTRYQWVGLGNADIGMTDGKLCMSINEKGLAAVMNSGEKCIDNSTNPNGKRTPDILKAVMSNCASIDEALEMVRGFVADNDYLHDDKGSIFFFMDRDAAYIVEMTAHYISPMRYDHGYAFRANIWHNPDMASFADNDVATFLNSANREYMVLTGFNRAIRARGRFAVEDSITISRETELPDTPIERRVCSQYTNSSATLELDREYPFPLSTAYVLIGPPRQTICVPVPIAMRDVHPTMRSQAWRNAAWKRFDELGVEAPVPAEWLAFEKESFAQYRTAQGKARELMRAGKQLEAVALIQMAAMDIWDAGAKLLALE